MKIIGNMVGGFALTSSDESFIIIDSDNNEYVGVVVGEETVFTATAEDIVAGKTAGTEQGVVTGTHHC